MNFIKYSGLLVASFCYFFTTTTYAQSIHASKDTLKNHLYYLASEEFNGRATGTPEQKAAAFYIKNEFEKYGLSPLHNDSYFQYYSLKRKVKNFHTIKSEGNIIFWPWHFFYTASHEHHDTVTAEMQFCGYGTLPEITDLNISKKVIAFLANDPKKAFDKIKAIRNTYGNKIFVVLFPEKNRDCETAWTAEYDLTYYDLANRFESNLQKEIHEEWAQPKAVDSLQIYYCFPNVMRNVFGMRDDELEKIAKNNLKTTENNLKEFPAHQITLISTYVDSIQEVVVENVGGIIYGADTTQTIVVSAHHDHIGEDLGKINYGADDNASGTVALLESARQLSKVFTNGKKPERNILFLSFSGEEMGLFGSEAYAQNPVFPMDRTVININMDMIGRWDKQHENHKSFVYLLTAGQNSKNYYKLGRKKIDTPLGFEVSNKPGAKELLVFKYGSDHYSFYQRNVPIAVFFTGLHDDYHTPKDIPEKINYTNLTNITNLVAKYIYKIAMDTVNYPLR